MLPGAITTDLDKHSLGRKGSSWPDFECSSVLKSAHLEDPTIKSDQKFPGIAETCFDIDGIRVNLIDVGGQRSERKKWLHCFESVDAVIFVAAMQEYDQLCHDNIVIYEH